MRMKLDSFARKITAILIVKLFLLIIGWKLFFSHPLSEQQKYQGISASILSRSGV